MKKHISYRSSELLFQLIQEDLQFFSLSDAMRVLSSSEPDAVRKLLADMTNRGLLLRIKDGLYHIIPFEKDSKEYFPNWHLTARAMVYPQNYYIGFYSALDIHGLITQPSLSEQVVTEKQVIPKIKRVRNVNFEFITFSKNKFFGFEKTWIDDFNKVNCSDLEKTFIDCLYIPSYAGGISEIVKAIYKSREKIKPERIIEYLERFDAQVVYKRLGFVLQHLDILKELRIVIHSKLTSSYTLLDPSLTKKGKHSSYWKIIDNVDIKSALKSIGT
jgi:predicted transcriptional regulator of viral defense system